MRRRIILHGALKSIHPEPIGVEAPTIADAIRIVTMQLPGFRPDAINGRHRVQASGCDTFEDYFAPSEMRDIHLRPALAGAKNGGFIEVALGAVLIAASFATPAGWTLGSLAVSSLFMSAGVSMLLGGILQLIQAPARDLGDPATIKSHYLGSPQNTTAIGTRIPILYGRRNVAGHYLSFNMDSVEIGL